MERIVSICVPATGNHAVVDPQHLAGVQAKLQNVLGASEFAIQSIHRGDRVFAERNLCSSMPLLNPIPHIPEGKPSVPSEYRKSVGSDAFQIAIPSWRYHVDSRGCDTGMGFSRYDSPRFVTSYSRPYVSSVCPSSVPIAR